MVVSLKNNMEKAGSTYPAVVLRSTDETAELVDRATLGARFEGPHSSRFRLPVDFSRKTSEIAASLLFEQTLRLRLQQLGYLHSQVYTVNTTQLQTIRDFAQRGTGFAAIKTHESPAVQSQIEGLPNLPGTDHARLVDSRVRVLQSVRTDGNKAASWIARFSAIFPKIIVSIASLGAGLSVGCRSVHKAVSRICKDLLGKQWRAELSGKRVRSSASLSEPRSRRDLNALLEAAPVSLRPVIRDLAEAVYCFTPEELSAIIDTTDWRAAKLLRMIASTKTNLDS
jgi:hypothetical protein